MGAQLILPCEVCGVGTRSKYRVCRSTPECERVRTRRKRVTNGRKPWTPPAWRQALWEEQQGLCYLCREPLPPGRWKTAIDHDHACCPDGRSCAKCRRGLAHISCNVLVSMAGDDPEKLMRIAISFAKVHAETRQRTAASS